MNASEVNSMSGFLIKLNEASKPGDLLKWIISSSMPVDLCPELNDLNKPESVREFFTCTAFRESVFFKHFLRFQDRLNLFVKLFPTKMSIQDRRKDLVAVFLERVEVKEKCPVAVDLPHLGLDILELTKQLTVYFVNIAHPGKVPLASVERIIDDLLSSDPLMKCVRMAIDEKTLVDVSLEEFKSFVIARLTNDEETIIEWLLQAMKVALSSYFLQKDNVVQGLFKFASGDAVRNSEIRDTLGKMFTRAASQIDALSSEDFIKWCKFFGLRKKSVDKLNQRIAISTSSNTTSMRDLGDPMFKYLYKCLISDTSPEAPDSRNKMAFETEFIDPVSFSGYCAFSYLDSIFDTIQAESKRTKTEFERSLVPLFTVNQSSGYGKSRYFHRPVPGYITVYMCFRLKVLGKSSMHGYPLSSDYASDFVEGLFSDVEQALPVGSLVCQKSVLFLNSFLVKIVHFIKESEKYKNRRSGENGLFYTTDEFDFYQKYHPCPVEVDCSGFLDSNKVLFVLDELCSQMVTFEDSVRMRTIDISAYNILRQVLGHARVRSEKNYLVAGKKYPLLWKAAFACIDTNTTAYESEISKIMYSSEKMCNDLKLRYPEAFVLKTTQDLFVDGLVNLQNITRWDLYIFTNASLFASFGFGRPLWCSFLRRYEGERTIDIVLNIFRFAIEKYFFQKSVSIGTLKWDTDGRSLLYQTLMVTTGIISPLDSLKSVELVNNRLAFLHAIRNDGSLSISYVSEPILAAIGLETLRVHFSKILETFEREYNEKLVALGSIGELVSCVLILLAFSCTKVETNIIPEFPPNYFKENPDEEEVEDGTDLFRIINDPTFSNLFPKPTFSFLKNLMGAVVFDKWFKAMKNSRNSERLRELDDLLNGFVQVNHLIAIPLSERDLNLGFKEAILRRAMLKFHVDSRKAHYVIPVVTRSGLIGGIGISAKRDVSLRSCRSTLFERMLEISASKFSPSFNTTVFDSNEYGGNTCKNPWLFIVLSLYDFQNIQEPSDSESDASDSESNSSDSESDAFSNNSEKPECKKQKPDTGVHNFVEPTELPDTENSSYFSGQKAEEDERACYIDENLNIVLLGLQNICPDYMAENSTLDIVPKLEHLLHMTPGVTHQTALEHKSAFPLAIRSFTLFYKGIQNQLVMLKEALIGNVSLGIERVVAFWSAVLTMMLSLKCGDEYYGFFYTTENREDALSLEEIQKWLVDKNETAKKWSLDKKGVENFVKHFSKDNKYDDTRKYVYGFVVKFSAKMKEILEDPYNADPTFEYDKSWCHFMNE